MLSALVVVSGSAVGEDQLNGEEWGNIRYYRTNITSGDMSSFVGLNLAINFGFKFG